MKVIERSVVKHATGKRGQYLYAIVADPEGCVRFASGLDGAPVYPISDGQVAAVVSDVPKERIRPERRHVAAHEEVLRRLLEQTTPLPMSFGIIADGPADIRRILALNRDVIAERLRHVAGRVEMGLTVSWDVPNIFEYFVSTHDGLRAARDRVFRRAIAPTRDDKIELGRLFERTLDADRAAHTQRIIRILRPHCCEIKETKPHSEQEIMNLACLIARGARDTFEQSVLAAASLWDNSYRFHYNGPWPPHNFVEAHLQM